MSQATAKQVRRAARRLAGDNGVQAIQELQQNTVKLANSLNLAHQRIDRLFEQNQELLKRIEQARDDGA